MAGCICGEFKVSSLVDNGVEKEAGVACVGVNGVVGWVCSGVETVACVVVDEVVASGCVSGVCVLWCLLRWRLCFEGEDRPLRLRCCFFLWWRECFSFNDEEFESIEESIDELVEEFDSETELSDESVEFSVLVVCSLCICFVFFLRSFCRSR